MKKKTAALAVETHILMPLTFHNAPASLPSEFVKKTMTPNFAGNLNVATQNSMRKPLTEQDSILPHTMHDRAKTAMLQQDSVGRWINTVKLRIKTARTINLNHVKRAEKHAETVHTCSGGYELLFPTKLNEELKPCIGKTFDVDVVEEGETLMGLLHMTNAPNQKTVFTQTYRAS